MKIDRFFVCSNRSRCFSAAGLLLFLALAVMLLPQSMAGQHAAVPKLTLAQVEQLVSHGVPDSTLSTQVQKRGLAFTPNPVIVESLRAKGAGAQTLAAIEEFFPEAPLAQTMQFIQEKLNGLGNVSFTAFTQNTANGSTGNNNFTYQYSNVVADQSQCRVSFHANSTRDGSIMWDGNYGFSLRDVQEIVVKPYTQNQTESNASNGLPNLVCTSINPPMTALLLNFSNGGKQSFPFADAALANRVAKTLRHAVKLCSGNNAKAPIPSAQHAAIGVTQRTLVSGLNSPSGIAVDGSDNVFVTEPVDANTPLKEILAGDGYTTARTVCTGRSIWGMAVDVNGHIFLAGPGFNEVDEVEAAGCTIVESLPSTEGFAVAVAVDGRGIVYLADNGIPRNGTKGSVKEIPSGCASASCVQTLGGGFDQPRGVAVDGSGNVFVADRGNNAVKEIKSGCTYTYCVKALGGDFKFPSGVAVDGGGNVFVADTRNSAVKEIPPGCESGSCVKTLGGDFKYPEGVAVDRRGNVFVLDSGNNRVVELENAGTKADFGGSNESKVNAKVPRKVILSADVMSDMLLEKTVPVYPPIARAARVSGTVVLQTSISKTGSVEDLQIISGPPMLQNSALEAVRSWRYKPYLLNNKPVEVETTVNVIFTLGG